MKTVTVLVVRPLWFKGRSYPAGATIAAAPLEAQGLVGSTRARLANLADAEAVRVAVIADRDATMGEIARQNRLHESAGGLSGAPGPWRRVA
jgi:hypothetical protein